MQLIEILCIVGGVLVVSSVLGVYIYKRIKHLPTGDCACCTKKGKSLVDQYNETYKCSCKKK